MAAAIRAVNRTHANYGYRRPLKDDYIERSNLGGLVRNQNLPVSRKSATP